MENWLWHVAALKVAKRLVQIVVAWIIGHNLGRFGVTIDQVQLSAGIWAGLEAIRNYLKVKYKVSWL